MAVTERETKHFCGKTTELPLTESVLYFSPVMFQMWIVSWSLRSTSSLGREMEHHRNIVSQQQPIKTPNLHIPVLKQPIKTTQWTCSGQTQDPTFWTNRHRSMDFSTGGAIRSCGGYRNGQGWLGKAEEEEEGKVEQEKGVEFLPCLPVRSFEVRQLCQKGSMVSQCKKYCTNCMLRVTEMLFDICISLSEEVRGSFADTTITLSSRA